MVLFTFQSTPFLYRKNLSILFKIKNRQDIKTGKLSISIIPILFDPVFF